MTMISTGLSTLGGAVMSATTATLDSLDMTSGANDIIIVRHDDDTLQSSPFNVRFGKAKVIRRSDKYVYVEVNGKRVKGVVLKLGPSGEAFWVQPASKEVPPEARCSPITSPRSSPGGSPTTDKPMPPPEVPPMEGDLGGGVAADVLAAKEAEQAAIDAAIDHHVTGQAQATSRTSSSIPPVVPELGQSYDSALDMSQLAFGTPMALKEDLTFPGTQSAIDMSALGSCYGEDVSAMLGDDEADKLVMKESGVLREMSKRLHPEGDGGEMQTPLETSPMHPSARDNVPYPTAATGSQPMAVPVSQPQAIPVAKRDSDGEDFSGLRLARSAEKEEQSYLAQRLAEEAAAQKAESVLAKDGGEDPTAGGLPTDIKLVVWRKMTDKDGKTYYWNMRTNEITYDEPAPADIAADSDYDEEVSNGDAPNLSDDEDDREEYENDQFTCAKTLYPSCEQLAQLGLKDGENEITFVVYTTLRGKQTVSCYAYLWDANSQLVVSDVDGTITRSDVLGHILPKVGKDWTHKGICSLYQRIAQNGYKLIYLSSRSISQIASTRAFIEGVCQDDKRLPRAPILVAPDRIFAAFTREVVQRTPHEFKCRMLHTVRMAFPETVKDPFYAGFGNRVNDAWAYAAVGIKQHKIFLIDPDSEIHVFDKRVKMSTYGSLDQLADQAFPPLRPKAKVVASEFNQFNFWCLSPGLGIEDDFDPNDLDVSGRKPVKEHVDPTTASMQSLADTGRLPTDQSPAPRPPGLAAAWGSPVSMPQPPVQMIEKALQSSPMRSPPRSPGAQPAESPHEAVAAAAAAAAAAATAQPKSPTAVTSEASTQGGWGITSYIWGRRSPTNTPLSDERKKDDDGGAKEPPQPAAPPPTSPVPADAAAEAPTDPAPADDSAAGEAEDNNDDNNDNANDDVEDKDKDGDKEDDSSK